MILPPSPQRRKAAKALFIFIMAAAAGPTTTVEIVDYSTAHVTSTIYVAPAPTTSSSLAPSIVNPGHSQKYGEFPIPKVVSMSNMPTWLSGAGHLSGPPFMHVATSLHPDGPPLGPGPAGIHPTEFPHPAFLSSIPSSVLESLVTQAEPRLTQPASAPVTDGNPGMTHKTDGAPTSSSTTFLTSTSEHLTVHGNIFISSASTSTGPETTAAIMSTTTIVSGDALSILAHANVITTTVTDTTTVGQATTTTSAQMSTLYSTSTMTTTVVVPITMTSDLSTSTSALSTSTSMPATSSSTSQIPVGITAAPAPLPSNPTALNATAVEQCLTEPGGVQKAGQLPQPGCGAIFQHLEDCYGSLGPWSDPYNTSQSLAFQSCLCETTATTPFGKNNMLWQNFTGCANCLESFTSGILVDTLAAEFSNIESFCYSQNPVAYLVISNFEAWLAALNAGITLTAPPITGAITAIGSLSSLFTTVPPLANLAYGVSAPPDGTLAGVMPELMTATIIMPASGGHPPSTKKITKLLDWKPTAAPSGTVSLQFDTAAASMSAASVANSELHAALSTLAAQGGPSQMCHGKCPHSGGTRWRPSLAVIATISVLLTSVMMGACL